MYAGEVLDGVSNDDLKLVIVMIVTPGVMNVFQFCVRRALAPRPVRWSVDEAGYARYCNATI